MAMKIFFTKTKTIKILTLAATAGIVTTLAACSNPTDNNTKGVNEELGLSDLSNYCLQAELSKTQQELSRYQEALSVLKQPNNRLLAIKSITPDISSSGSLVIAPNSEAAILSLKNLPNLPENKVYRLWAFVDGKKIKCAKFNPDDRGKVLLKIPLQKWGSTTEVFITIEPKQGFELPVGETVMKGSRAI